MNARLSIGSIGLAVALACAAVSASVQSANAGPVTTDVWYEFSFGGPGTSLTNGFGLLFPATNAPDGNPVVLVDDSPWTINLAGPATLTVVDLFSSFDQFEILDFGAVIGMTSVPTGGGTCDSNITCALGDPRYSRGVFLLAAGPHSLTGAHLAGIPGGLFSK